MIRLLLLFFKPLLISLSFPLSVCLLFVCVRTCTNLVLSCRGNQPIITHTSATVEVVVPRAVVPEIYGEDGECLRQILQVNLLHLIIYVHFVTFNYAREFTMSHRTHKCVVKWWPWVYGMSAFEKVPYVMAIHGRNNW